MVRRVPVGLGLTFLALLLSILAVACGSVGEEATATIDSESDEGAALDGQALTEERCSVCHGLDRIESAKKTPEEWRANVERMVDQGAELNGAEQEAVIEYLSETYPE